MQCAQSGSDAGTLLIGDQARQDFDEVRVLRARKDVLPAISGEGRLLEASAVRRRYFIAGAMRAEAKVEGFCCQAPSGPRLRGLTRRT